MQTDIINDPASISRQALLLAAHEATAAEWADRADRWRQGGNRKRWAECQAVSGIAAENAMRVRQRLVAPSGLTTDDVQPGLADLLARLPDEKFEQIAPTTGSEQQPEAFQANPTPVCRTLPETIWWLRFVHPDMWWSASWETLIGVATWLLALRRACWSGRWVP